MKLAHLVALVAIIGSMFVAASPARAAWSNSCPSSNFTRLNRDVLYLDARGAATLAVQGQFPNIVYRVTMPRPYPFRLGEKVVIDNLRESNSRPGSQSALGYVANISGNVVSLRMPSLLQQFVSQMSLNGSPVTTYCK